MYIRGLKFIFISIFNHQYTKYKFRLDAKHECLTGIPYINAGHLWILHKIHTNSDKAFHLLNVFIKLVTYIKQKLETGSYLSGPSFHIQNMETHCAYRYTYIAYTYMYTYIHTYVYIHTEASDTRKSPTFSTKWAPSPYSSDLFRTPILPKMITSKIHVASLDINIR